MKAGLSLSPLCETLMEDSSGMPAVSGDREGDLDLALMESKLWGI